MRKLFVAGFLLVIISGVMQTVSGMSAPEHIEGMRWLNGTDEKTAKSVTSWMDKPATQTGEYLNQKAGGVPVHPTNHNALRHNPVNVAKALSGDGTVAPEKLNPARVHKLQDIKANKMPVDGWDIKPSMKVDSEKILNYLADNGKLPEKLPNWVDESGPLLKEASGKTAAKTTGPIAKSTGVAVLKTAGKAVPFVAPAFPVAIAAWELNSANECYAKGEISEEELEALQIEIIWGNIAGSGGAWGGGFTGGLLGTTLGPLGTIGFGIGGSIFVGTASEYITRKCVRMFYEGKISEAKYTQETNERLFKNTTLKEDEN